jgi:hypothetical protein
MIIDKLSNQFYIADNKQNFPADPKVNKFDIWLIVSELLLYDANSANFPAISWREQVNFQWNDDEVRFGLSWIFSHSSLKHETTVCG